jgi:hypothetical protein
MPKKNKTALTCDRNFARRCETIEKKIKRGKITDEDALIGIQAAALAAIENIKSRIETDPEAAGAQALVLLMREARQTIHDKHVLADTQDATTQEDGYKLQIVDAVGTAKTA